MQDVEAAYCPIFTSILYNPNSDYQLSLQYSICSHREVI